MKSHPRGLALILSNVHFSSETDLEFRSGGNVDQTALEMLFRHLGYQVMVRHDQTAQVSPENGTSMMNVCILEVIFYNWLLTINWVTDIISNVNLGILEQAFYVY